VSHFFILEVSHIFILEVSYLFILEVSYRGFSFLYIEVSHFFILQVFYFFILEVSHFFILEVSYFFKSEVSHFFILEVSHLFNFCINYKQNFVLVKFCLNGKLSAKGPLNDSSLWGTLYFCIMNIDLRERFHSLVLTNLGFSLCRFRNMQMKGNKEDDVSGLFSFCL